MRQNEIASGLPGLKPSCSIKERKTQGGRGGAQQRDAGTRNDRLESQAAEARDRHPMPRSHRELGEAILAGGNAVKVGRELLDKDKSEDRGAPTRLRSLQTFADWAFERPGTEGNRRPPRIIWDIPGPPYEPVDPELEKEEGGKK